MTVLWEFDGKHPKQVSAYGAQPLPSFLLCEQTAVGPSESPGTWSESIGKTPFSAQVRLGEPGAPVQNHRPLLGDEIRKPPRHSNLDKDDYQLCRTFNGIPEFLAGQNEGRLVYIAG
jgi:hypothetical protein